MDIDQIRKYLGEAFPLESHEELVTLGFVGESIEVDNSRVYATLRLFVWEGSSGERELRDVKEQEVYLGRVRDFDDAGRYRAFSDGIERRMNAIELRALQAMLPGDLVRPQMLGELGYRTGKDFARFGERDHVQPAHRTDDVNELEAWGLAPTAFEETGDRASTRDLEATLEIEYGTHYLVLRDIDSGEIMGTVTRDERIAEPVVFSASGEWLACPVAADDGICSDIAVFRVLREPVRYVDLDEVLRLVDGPQSRVEAFAFSGDARTIACRHQGGEVTIYRVPPRR